MIDDLSTIQNLEFPHRNLNGQAHDIVCKRLEQVRTRTGIAASAASSHFIIMILVEALYGNH